MSENKKFQEFLQKLAPCIKRRDLDACVEESARLAGEIGVGAEELLELSSEEGSNGRHDYAYVLALAAARGLKNHKKAEAYSYAGFSADFIGKLREAERYYKKVIEIDPNHAEARNNYANILREKELFADAEKEIRNSLQIAEENPLWQQIRPYAHGNLGDILADEGYLEEAIKEYQAALKNSASMEPYLISKIRNNLGWVYVQLKKYTKAKDEFRKAHAIDSMNVKAIRNLRKLRKLEVEPEISTTQIFLGIMLLLSLILSYIFFWIGRLSEEGFLVHIIILIALLIFVFMYCLIEKFKISPSGIEFEKSPGFKETKRDTLTFEK